MQTQISIRLKDPLLRRLDHEARKRRVHRSDLIREALESFLAGGGAPRQGRPFDLVRDLAGSVSGGPPDLGERHREYLRDLIGDRR